MTDLESLRAMFDRNKVPYELRVTDLDYVKESFGDDIACCIELWNWTSIDSEPTPGYGGFLSNWFFDKEGKLIAIGHWG